MIESKVLSKVVLLGNLHAGKTTLLNSYCGNSNENRSTISQDCRKMEIKVGTTAVTLQLWDTAGQEQFNSIGFAFYRGANCCILVFDMSNRESFESLEKWKRDFIEHANPTDPEQFPFIVVGNKNDLEKVVTAEEAVEWCSKNRIDQFFETCAKDGVNVDLVFKQAAKVAADANASSDFAMPTSLSGAGGAIKMSREDDVMR